jgi:collagen triple helix repeat protein
MAARSNQRGNSRYTPPSRGRITRNVALAVGATAVSSAGLMGISIAASSNAGATPYSPIYMACVDTENHTVIGAEAEPVNTKTFCVGEPYYTETQLTGPQGFQGNQGYQGPQGYQGSQGFQGNQGFQGFQGLVTTTIVTATGTATIASSTTDPGTGEAVATCPSGDVVTGGGGSANSFHANLSKSYPNSTTSWDVLVANYDDTSSQGFTVYAICTPVPST